MKRRGAVLGLALLVILSGSVGRTQPAPEGTGTEPPPAEEQPKEKKSIAAEGDTIKINFPEMEMENVLKNFSAITGKNFILDQMPKGQIRTIGPIGPVEIPKKQAFNLFVLIMSMNGYNVVPTSVPNVYKVVRTADAMRENIPVYPPGSRPTANEAMVTRFITLQYISASEIAGQLGALTSKEGGQVIAYQPSNTLIIVDTALNIERMLKIVKLLDVAGAEPEMEILKLQYTEANDVASILGQVYQGASISAAPRSATTRGQGPRQRNAPNAPAPPAAPQPAAAGGGESTTKIIPLERMNALLVIADPDIMDAIKALIVKLDVDAGQTPTIHVYYVQNAQAEDLASTLSGLSGGRNSATRTTSSSTSAANRPQLAGFGNVPTPAPAPTPVQTRTQVAGGNILEGMFGSEISINADEATNSLIVVATPQDYQLLLQVIRQLDIPRRQVFVEAVLLEVTYSESRAAGVSMHGVSPLENNGMLLAGTNLADVNSMSLLSSLLASSSGSLTMPNGITVGALGQPVEVPGTNGQVVLPSAGLIVRLLASESSVNVLSTPTILTTDNEEASLEVGQKIPVQTGSSTSGVGYSTISISRESVGIKLKITPQINESDAIRLEIFTEISSVASTDSTMGPTTSLKTAETTVIVRDSQTIVIGGLMEDRRDISTSKIPWLGDIPALGWLFKNTNRGKNKTNLIILITPHIVKSDSDVERVKKHIRQGYEDMTEESQGEGAPDWASYFDSQLREPKESIDLRSGQPQVVPAPEWGWTPAAPGSQPPSTPASPAPAKTPPPAPDLPAPASGDTAGSGPRSATTNGAPPGTPRR